MQKDSLKREDIDFIVSRYNIKTFALFNEEKSGLCEAENVQWARLLDIVETMS